MPASIEGKRDRTVGRVTRGNRVVRGGISFEIVVDENHLSRSNSREGGGNHGQHAEEAMLGQHETCLSQRSGKHPERAMIKRMNTPTVGGRPGDART